MGCGISAAGRGDSGTGGRRTEAEGGGYRAVDTGRWMQGGGGETGCGSGGDGRTSNGGGGIGCRMSQGWEKVAS